MLDAGTGSGFQLRSLSSLSPWKSPQSTIRRSPPASTRYFEPVTVPVAPRKVRVATFCPLRFELDLGCFADDVQAWDTFKVAAIVSNQGKSVPNGTGGNPKVVIANDSARPAGSSQSIFEPGIGPANLNVEANDGCFANSAFEELDPIGAPFSSLCPKVEFTNCDIGNYGDAVLNVGPIKVGPRVLSAKKKKGENIGVEKTFIHTVAI